MTRPKTPLALSIACLAALSCDQRENFGDEETPSFRSISGDSVFNVRDAVFGAVGDCSTDDTVAIQLAISHAEDAGGSVFFPDPGPGSCYLVSDTLSITAPVTLWSADRAEIRDNAAADFDMFDIDSSGVTLRKLRLQSNAGGLYDVDSSAIRITGVSAANPAEGVRIEDVEIDGFGMYGIYAKYVRDFEITDNQLTNLGYSGVMIVSGAEGTISDNRVATINGNSPVNPNAYGIALTRAKSGNLGTDPNSRDIVVSNNTVRGVPTWHGLDTHGGERVTFSNNVVYDTYRAINIVGNEQPDTDARNVVVVGNNANSSVLDGSRSNGIQLANVTGATICDNAIRGYGTLTNSNGGGIQMKATQGVTVCNNQIRDVSPHGIVLWFDNYDFVVSGNVSTDVWREGAGRAAGVYVPSNNNQGYIGENRAALESRPLGTESPLTHGVWVHFSAAVTGNELRLGDNSALDAADAESFIGASADASTVLASRRLELDGANFRVGNGDPEGNVVGNPGDLYLNKNGTQLQEVTLYVKESGTNNATGWVGK